MTLRPLCGALALVVALCASAVTAQPSDPAPGVANATVGALEPNAVSAAAEIVAIAQDRADRMTVPVGIDGRGPFSFLIDTGSERTVVSRDIAARLMLEFAQVARLVSIAGSKMVETVYVPGLTLGRQNYGEVVAPILESHHIGADGILGLDGLQDQRILFDFTSNAISIEDVTRRAPISGFEIVVTARRKSGQLIFTDATLGGRRISVVIDTGAQANIGNLALLRRLGNGKRLTQDQGSLISVTGQSIDVDAGFASDFRIGRAQFDYVPILFTDSEAFTQLGLDDTPALLLGMGTLRAFSRMMIDFKQRRVLFDMPGKAARKPAGARI
ncbi:retroviral-like aspartic protease family protein [Blastomonas sp.]|uniref:retroviral-like aspartic protease family protein n=1 Tax=Blastomonas sp. TaxID=1909299 RepID=UPI0026082637|nr:retroviral-like aspartic protease family protein [Blastomonas sp.]MDM7956924.1 retroviral-like aspartic protease family protein [Blastomonas sp.]